MDSNIVTRTTLAKELGVSAPMVSKYIAKNVLNKCFVPDTAYKKLYLDKCLDAINRFKTREPAQKTKPKKVPNKETKKLIQKATKKGIKETREVYNDENIEELERLVELIDSPKQKVDTIDVFWRGKTNKIKHYQLVGELIPIGEAQYTIEKILSPLNRYLNDQPSTIMSHFPDTDPLMLKWLSEENDRAKGKLEDIN